MAKHGTLVVAEFHLKTENGVAHWFGVITRKQYDELAAIKSGILDFGVCFGKPGRDFCVEYAKIISSFRLVSELRNDVMACNHAIGCTGRKYIGNVDFPSALCATEKQNKEELRELAGVSIEDEPLDGEDIAASPIFVDSDDDNSDSSDDDDDMGDFVEKDGDDDSSSSSDVESDANSSDDDDDSESSSDDHEKDNESDSDHKRSISMAHDSDDDDVPVSKAKRREHDMPSPTLNVENDDDDRDLL